MMKRENKSIFYVLIIAIAILAILAVPVSAKKLATPVPISPPTNQVFYDYQGWVICTWKPVPGAGSYVIEIQFKDNSAWKPFDARAVSDTGTLSQIYPAGTYRWRVSAINGNPAETSNPSTWRTFTFNWEKTQLSKPVPITPKSGTLFYNTPRIFILEWKPVIGADSYSVNLQYYAPSIQQWADFSSLPIIVSGTHCTSYRSAIYAASQCRWSVQAQDSTGAWLNSDPIPWQTFTFKN